MLNSIIQLIIVLHIFQVFVATLIRLNPGVYYISKKQYVYILLLPFSGLFIIIWSALNQD